MPGRTDDKIRCSFCGKTQDQVRKLIAGTDNVYICDDCIELCSEIDVYKRQGRNGVHD